MAIIIVTSGLAITFGQPHNHYVPAWPGLTERAERWIFLSPRVRLISLHG